MTARLARTETFEHAISGLLKRRAELQDENAALRERLAAITLDVEAIDRVLDSLGYAGELENRTARQERLILFYRGELRNFVLRTLREAGEPISTRAIAMKLCETEKGEGFDRKLLSDVVRRCSKALRQMRAMGTVRSAGYVGGAAVWALTD